jgi:hypothetical protein
VLRGTEVWMGPIELLERMTEALRHWGTDWHRGALATKTRIVSGEVSPSCKRRRALSCVVLLAALLLIFAALRLAGRSLCR